MAEVKVTIVTQGGDQAAREIGKVTSASKQANQATADSTRADAKNLAVKQQLLGTFRGLGAQIPAMGIAIRALINPWTLLGAALGVAIGGLTKIAELIRVNPFVPFANTTARAATATNTLADATTALGEAQKKLLETTRAANEQLEERLQQLEAATAAELKLVDAEEQRDLARIDAEEADPDRRARRRADIVARAAEQRSGLSSQGRTAAIALIGAEIAATEVRQQAVEGSVPSVENMTDRVLAAQTARESLAGILGRRRDRLLRQAQLREAIEAAVFPDDKTRLRQELGSVTAEIEQLRQARPGAESAFSTALGNVPSALRAPSVSVAEFVAGQQARAAELGGAEQALRSRLRARLGRLGFEGDTASRLHAIEMQASALQSQGDAQEHARQGADALRKAAAHMEAMGQRTLNSVRGSRDAGSNIQ